ASRARPPPRRRGAHLHQAPARALAAGRREVRRGLVGLEQDVEPIAEGGMAEGVELRLGPRLLAQALERAGDRRRGAHPPLRVRRWAARRASTPAGEAADAAPRGSSASTSTPARARPSGASSE